MQIRFTALPTDTVRALQAGAPDAYGRMPERHVSDGEGNPCRHCLRFIPEGADMLILAHRPFPEFQPYAETGPIFLCAGPCERHAGTAEPAILGGAPEFLLRGYSAEHRIVYGTGRVTPRPEIAATAAAMLGDARVAYVHLRSARNNCYQARIERA